MQLLMQQLSGVNSHLVDYRRNANEICKYGIAFMLTYRGRAKHICVSNLTIIASDNGWSPGRRQAIIWTSAGILLIGPLGTSFSETLVEIITFSFKKITVESVVCEMAAILSRLMVPEYSTARSPPSPLIALLIVLPVHHQPWYTLWRTNASLSSMRKDNNYLCHTYIEKLCQEVQVCYTIVNTLRPRQIRRRFPDIFKCIFLKENVSVKLRLQWSLFPKVQLAKFLDWFRWWLRDDQAYMCHSTSMN